MRAGRHPPGPRTGFWAKPLREHRYPDCHFRLIENAGRHRVARPARSFDQLGRHDRPLSAVRPVRPAWRQRAGDRTDGTRRRPCPANRTAASPGWHPARPRPGASNRPFRLRQLQWPLSCVAPRPPLRRCPAGWPRCSPAAAASTITATAPPIALRFRANWTAAPSGFDTSCQATTTPPPERLPPFPARASRAAAPGRRQASHRGRPPAGRRAAR